MQWTNASVAATLARIRQQLPGNKEANMVAWIALLTLLLLAEASEVVVELTDMFYATGRLHTTSSGNELHHFAGIPYAWRAESFAMPEPIVYTSQLRQTADMAIHVNPSHAVTIAPSQSMGEMPDATLRFLDLPVHKASDAHCQQLDIFRPANITEEPMRVVVYVHGGFMEADSRYSMLYRVDDLLRDMPYSNLSGSTIVATVEYSLGAYGWWHEEGVTGVPDSRSGGLKAEFGKYPANVALHQVIQALLWIQRNIASFGGDPTRVTLAGHSAGAAIAQWVHLVLSQRVLRLYDFEHVPFSQLLLMGGTALLFPATSIQAAHETQQNVISRTPCASLPPGIGRLACIAALSHNELHEVVVSALVIWLPVIDGTLITASTKDILFRRAGTDNHWISGIRVFAMTTPSEAAIFCKLHEPDIVAEKSSFWDEYEENRVKHKSRKGLDPHMRQNEPFRYATERTTELFFLQPTILIQEAYQEGGIDTQIGVVHVSLKADLASFVIAKLDAICRARFALSLTMIRNMVKLHVKSKSFAAQVKSHTRTLSGTLLRPIQTLGNAFRSVSSLSAKTAQSSFGSLFTRPRKRQIRQVKVQPLELVKDNPSVDQTEQKGMFGIAHLTPQRLEKLMQTETISALLLKLEQHIDSMGLFHGLDQAILLNMQVSVYGVPIRMDELIPSDVAVHVIYPVHSFIATGIATHIDMTPLYTPNIHDHDLARSIDVSVLMRSFRARGTDPSLTDAEAWMKIVDDLPTAAQPSYISTSMRNLTRSLSNLSLSRSPDRRAPAATGINRFRLAHQTINYSTSFERADREVGARSNVLYRAHSSSDSEDGNDDSN